MSKKKDNRKEKMFNEKMWNENEKNTWKTIKFYNECHYEH